MQLNVWQKGRNCQQSRLHACAIAISNSFGKISQRKYFIDPELFIVCTLDGVILM